MINATLHSTAPTWPRLSETRILTCSRLSETRIPAAVHCTLVLLLAFCAVIPATSRAGEEPTAITADGRSIPAQLLEIEPPGQISFLSGEPPQRVVIAAAELVQWGEFRDSDRPTQILLSDGSWLIGDVLHIGSDHLLVYTGVWGEVRLPLAAVQGLLFSPSPAAANRDAVRRQLTAGGSEDRLLLENGDRVSGAARGISQQETGRNEVTTVLEFSTQGRTVQLPLHRISGLAFRSPAAEQPARSGPRLLVGLADGSRLFVERFERTGSQVQLLLAARIRLETDTDWLWPEITGLQPLGSDVLYVSDLPSIGYRHIPLLEQALPLGRNSNSRGGLLRSGGRVYVRGLSMPTASRVAYALGGEYREFAAEIALDDLAGRVGSAVFRVFVSDPAGGWRAAYESPPVRGGDRPLSIVVDVTGAQTMALIADMGERGDLRDHANWLNARLIK